MTRTRTVTVPVDTATATVPVPTAPHGAAPEATDTETINGGPISDSVVSRGTDPPQSLVIQVDQPQPDDTPALGPMVSTVLSRSSSSSSDGSRPPMVSRFVRPVQSPNSHGSRVNAPGSGTTTPSGLRSGSHTWSTHYASSRCHPWCL